MIEWARVRELVDEIGAEDFTEVVDLFLQEVDGAIIALDAAGNNPILIEEQMHFLKGAALNLGFEALAQLCLKGEKAAKAGRPDVVTLDEISECYRLSRSCFEQDLPKRLAA